jgi:hypothetical protein
LLLTARRRSSAALGESTCKLASKEKLMKKEGECYYVLLDLHGPETTYQPLFEVLNPLRAQQLEHGWCSSVIVIRMSCIALNLSSALPGWSVYEPEIRYRFLLMSSGGYTLLANISPLWDRSSNRR